MIPAHLVSVFADAAFIDALNSDQEIKALESARVDIVDELAALCQVLGGRYRITAAEPRRRWFNSKARSLLLNPITPAVWAIWWALDLPFVHGRMEITEIDVDIALYTLSVKASEIGGSASGIAAMAEGMCKKHRIDYRDAAEVIAILAHDALRPLEMLPPSGNSTEALPEFGADWLTRICGSVAERMHYPAHLIAVERPLAEVALHYCWQVSAADSKLEVKRRTPEDICALIWERTLQLAEEWKAKHGSKCCN
jgi:hypothetical protein